MDCNHNRRSDAGWRCRPQRPTPPGMNTDCGCGADAQNSMRPPVRPQMRPPQVSMPMQQPSGVLPMQAGTAMGECCPGNQPMGHGMMPVQQAPVLIQPDLPGQMVDGNASVQMPSGCSDGFMVNTDMDQNQMLRPGSMAGMPIGMGYVPWQRWSQTYPLSQGFQRGTIFPELDLPFVMGRCRG